MRDGRRRPRTSRTALERFAIACALVLGSASHAWAWGSLGHQAIAEAAQGRLTRAADAGLARVFGHGDALAPGTLARASTWPDEVRGRGGAEGGVPGWDAADTREASEFNAAHPGNAAWHFVNLPLGATGYPTSTTPPHDAVRAFVRQDDIVQTLRRCIRILESPATPANFTRVQAVRWLVHLVADIHQPMHVTSGYYRVVDGIPALALIRSPEAARAPNIVGDRGGNGLLFPDGTNLHAVWDGCLVDRASGHPCVARNAEYTPLARMLTSRMAVDGAAFRGTGDHHGWPAQWATDSLRTAVASEAYPTKLAHGAVKTGRSDERYLEATIVSPALPAYVASHTHAASQQLLKAAVRLADLLNAMAWR